MVKSKFSRMVYGYGLLMTGLITLGIVFSLHPEWEFKNKMGTTNSALLPGLILIIGVGGILAFCLRSVIYIRIDPDGILLWSVWSRRTLARSEITGIKPLNASDDLTLSSADGQDYVLTYDVYRNMPQLKRYLRDNYSALIEFLPPGPAGPAATQPQDILDGEEISVFSGSFFTCYYGLYSTVIFGAAAFGIYYARHAVFALPILLLPFLVPCSIAFWGCGHELYFFRMAGDYLEINNYLFFWYRRVYRLDEIDRVLFEEPSRRSKSLRVRTKEFESDRYGASALRKKDWRAFYKALQAKQMPIPGGSPGGRDPGRATADSR